MTTGATRPFPERLRSGERLLGVLATLATPSAVEILVHAGFDWLWLDMEHGPLDVSTALGMVQARGKCPVLVRVPANDRVWIKRVLDLGCDGVILPHVSDPDAARAAVDAAHYPPRGTRSFGVSRAHAYGARIEHAMRHASDETAVVVQIEDVRAVERVDEIVAVPGIDAAVVGPFDLSGSMGRLGETSHPDVVRAIERVAAACAARGVTAGIFAPSIEQARAYLDMGYRLLALGVDAMILLRAAAELRAALDRG
jgi:2-dehydro-3-deoxyglucarate aldolase/4-hydroxy-2-oxoheptanedioate aldolase